MMHAARFCAGLGAASLLALVALLACSGGGGTLGGTASPADECKDFLQLTSDCFAQGGRQVGTNPAACDDPNAIPENQRGQITCALQYRDAYCKTIAASASRDAGAIDPRAPDMVKLNACYAASTLAAPCKDAVLALSDCGVAYGFGTCTPQAAAMATCILADTKAACSLYGRTAASGTTLSPAEQALQKCQLDAQRAALDAGR